MAAAREYVYLSGKGRWTKVFLPSEYKKYTTDLSLDQKSLGIALELKKRGVKNNIKNEDGEYWIVLSTPSEVDTRTKGLVVMDRPKVWSKDGSPWDTREGIGNGSDLTCKVWVRPYKNPRTGKDEVSLRLDSIVVENHIPFNPKNDFENARDQKDVSKLLENTSQKWMS